MATSDTLLARLMATLLNQRVKRTSHRNGVVATEETYRGRVPHGPVRRWHRNGLLARKTNREAAEWLASGDATNRASGRLSHK